MDVPGTVQTSPNPLLTSLKPGCTYKMKALINDGAFEVNGETELVNGLTTSASSQNFTFKFADDPAEYISTGVGVGSTGNAYIVNAQLDVFFNEHIGNNFTTNHSIGNLEKMMYYQVQVQHLQHLEKPSMN